MKDLILPRGPENASVFIIDDSPTEEDITNGRAFSGAGLIKKYCLDNNIDYENTYRTLYIKEKIYGGPNVKLKKESISKALAGTSYGEILSNELTTINPRIVVPIGELAFNAVTGSRGLTQFRGSILPLRTELQSKVGHNETRVIPTYGSKHVWTDYSNRTIASLDFAKVAREINTSGPFVTSEKVWIADTLFSLQDYITRHKTAEWGVFDIETKWNIPVCIGFALSPYEGICVPLLDRHLDLVHAAQIWQYVDKVLRHFKWVNQNIKYDILNLDRLGFRFDEDYGLSKRGNILGDTAIRSSVIYPEFPKKLGFLNSIYTEMPYFKQEGKDAPDRKSLYLYCAKDCVSTYQVYQKQEIDIVDLGLTEFNQKVQNLFWPYVRMDRRGLLIDFEQREKLRAKYEVLYEFFVGIIATSGSKKPCNPLSSKQCVDLLYKELGFPEQKSKKTGNATTDEDTLENLYIFHGDKSPWGNEAKMVLKYIIAARKIHKLIELIETPIHPDGRFRCSYDLGGTDTGRSAAKKSSDYLLIYGDKGRWDQTNIGHSLQTIGKHGFFVDGEEYGHDLMSMFVPTPGYVFCEGDGSQAEARVDAVLGKDWEFLLEFDKKPGVHCLTGSWVFGCEPTDIKKGSQEYAIAKMVRHACERNLGPDTLAKKLQKDLIYCKKIIDRLHGVQPSIRGVFHKEVVDHLKRNKVLISPQGRRRDFFGKTDHTMFNQGISFIPQATISDLMKFSIPELEENFPGLRLLTEKHDALLVEIEKDKLEAYHDKFKSIVERPIDFRKCSLSRDFELTIPAELAWSDTNLMELKDL